MTSITAAIRADAATSDAEGRRDLAGHLADFRAALLDEAALIAAADRSRFDSEVATLTATRDIVIGQRETAQRERDEARGLLGALTADLNATREKLATVEAHRDSLQAEVDGLRVERDAQQADLVGLHCAAAERDTVRELYKSACAERDALRAEVADFFAAAVAVAQALDDGGSLGPAGGERDPRAWVTFARGLADRVGSRVEQAVGNGDNLEAAQDAAAALWKAIDDQIVVEAEKVRDGSGVDWHSAYSGAIGTRAKAEAIVRAALAKLGAPATTPSKPADVFAGVSIGKLCDAYDCAGACGSADVAPRRYAGVMAVLDALRVKLVAPVDPEAVLADVFGAPHWRSFANEYRTARCVAMRATLTANGIPVTPEAGK